MKYFQHQLDIILKAVKLIAFSTLLSLQFGAARAVETVFYVDSLSGIAINGYDPISFFIRGKGEQGSHYYEYFWQGAVWRFENEGNLNAFRDNPLIYAPQFGGFDATKMAQNVKVTPNPHFSDLYDNRLYLFHSKKNLDEWLGFKEKLKIAAQENWQNLYGYSIHKNFVVQQVAKSEVKSKPKASEKSDADKKADSMKAEKKSALPMAKPINPNGNKLDSSDRLAAAAQPFKDSKN